MFPIRVNTKQLISLSFLVIAFILMPLNIVNAEELFFENPQDAVATEETYGEKIEIDYAYDKDDKYIYYYDNILEGADPSTFEILEDKYSKDKDSVFYGQETLEGADPNTFEVLDTWIAKDKDRVYYRDELSIAVDSSTLEEINAWYYKDKNNVYYTFNTFKLMPEADAETFKADSNNIFATDKNSVYRDGEIVEGADPATYELYTYKLGRDKDNIFYETSLLEGADASTFNMVLPNVAIEYIEDYKKTNGTDPETINMDLSDYADFFMDKNQVYLESQVIEGADPYTFEIIDEQYSKDKNSAYYLFVSESYYSDDKELRVIEDADPATFEVIDDQFSKDKDNIYHKASRSLSSQMDYECVVSLIISNPEISQEELDLAVEQCESGPDTETFEVLSEYYSKDKDSYYYSYYSPKSIRLADYDSFELINEFLARDKNHVYDKGDVLDWIDADSLVVVNESVIADKDHIYDVSDYPEIIEGISTTGIEGFNENLFKNQDYFYEVDGDRIYVVEGVIRHYFEIINDKYAKDRDYVYDIEYGIKIMRDVDPDTFEEVNGYYTKDKYNVYGYSKLDAADSAAFEVINEGYNKNYGKDASKVYVNSTVIPYADPDTFEYVGLVLSKDKRHVYMFAEKLEGVGTDIEFLNDYSDPDDDHWYNYFTDGNYIYCIDGYASVKRLNWVDVDTFKIVDDYRFKDKNGSYINSAGYSSFTTMAEECYVGECKVSSSYVSSSELIMNVEINDYDKVNDFYVKDNNNAYYLPYSIDHLDRAQPIFDIDSNTFEALDHFYTKDKNNVYYRWFKVPNADPKTFEVLNEELARDKDQLYYMGGVVKGADQGTLEVIVTEVEDEWYESLSQEVLDQIEEKHGKDWYTPEIELQIKDKNGIYEIKDGKLVSTENETNSYPYLRKRLLNGGFSDVGNSRYKDGIENLASMRIINGYDDGTFRPENPVNRAEALKIIFESLDHFSTYEYERQEFNVFPDIEDNAWYKPYVAAGVEKGIIKGYSDGTFKGANNVNLAEALKMLFEAHDIYIAKDNSELWYKKYYDTARWTLMLPFELPGPDKILTRAELSHIVSQMVGNLRNNIFGSEWYKAQKLENMGVYMGSGIAIKHEMKGDDRIKWSWSGNVVDDGVLYELWSGERLLGRTSEKYLITEYDNCSPYQSVRLRVSKNENANRYNDEDWSLWSKPYEVFIGEDGSITEGESTDLFMECLSEDKRDFTDKKEFIDIIGNFDPLLEMNLNRIAYLATCMTYKDKCEYESYEKYELYMYIMHIVSSDNLDKYYDYYGNYTNTDKVQKSIVYAIIAGINNIDDHKEMYEVAKKERSRRLAGTEYLDMYYDRHTELSEL